MSFFSARSVRRALTDAAPGHFTKDAVAYTQQLLEDLILKIVPDAKNIAASAGKRRVTKDEIRLAADKYVRK